MSGDAIAPQTIGDFVERTRAKAKAAARARHDPGTDARW